MPNLTNGLEGDVQRDQVGFSLLSCAACQECEMTTNGSPIERLKRNPYWRSLSKLVFEEGTQLVRDQRSENGGMMIAEVRRVWVFLNRKNDRVFPRRGEITLVERRKRQRNIWVNLGAHSFKISGITSESKD